MLSMAVTPGVLPRAVGSAVRGWTLPMVVLLVTAGVIGMHSLGATHHMAVSAAMTTADMPITTPEPPFAQTKHRVPLTAGFVAPIVRSGAHTVIAGSTLASDCATCPGAHAHRREHGHVDRAASSVDRTVTLVAVTQGAVMQGAVTRGAVTQGAVMGGHGLMAMCLAVLPLLALVLNRAVRGWSRLTQQRIPVPLLAGSGARWWPPPNTAVSLTRLCIQRT